MDLGVQVWVTPVANPLEPRAQWFEPVVNRNFVKPKHGLWTSTWLGEEKVSGWIEWCRSEGFSTGAHRTWLLTPEPEARIAVVREMQDLKTLLNLYPLHRGKSENHYMQYLDFERMARDFDGMHLTDAGQWETRLTEPNLYGWDCESTCWFRWPFDRVEQGPEIEVAEHAWDGDDDE